MNGFQYMVIIMSHSGIHLDSESRQKANVKIHPVVDFYTQINLLVVKACVQSESMISRLIA